MNAKNPAGQRSSATISGKTKMPAPIVRLIVFKARLVSPIYRLRAGAFVF